MHVYHYAAYEITALKRLMGRYGTREDEIDDLLRRDVFVDLLTRRPQRHPHLAAGLRAEGDRGLPRLRAAGGGEGRRHVDRHLRALDADRRPGAARPDRRVQPRGLHRDAAPARLAARAEAAAGPIAPAPPPLEPKPIPEGRPSGPRCARSCSTRARRSPRSCSTTTTASASRSGGRSSTGSR